MHHHDAGCFICLLAHLLSRLFACFPVSLLAMSIMFIYFMPLSYALCIFSFHCLSIGFLSLPLHVHIWSKNAWSWGMVSQTQAKKVKMGCIGSFRGLASPIWLCTLLNPFPYSLLSLLDGLY